MAAAKVALAVTLLLSSASALGLKKRTKLDINQVVYVEGQPVLGLDVGSGALNECRNFADFMVSNPDKPEVKVCGTGVKMTVFLLGRCGMMSTGRGLPSAGMAHTWPVGACDPKFPPDICETFSPASDKRFGASQSYKIEQC